MLKRNDLAKQFELVVQQEVKNHNDQLLATNLSINELRRQIDALSAKTDKEIAVLEQKNKLQQIDLQTLHVLFCNLSSQFQSHINDSRAINERNATQYQEVVEALERSFKENTQLKENIDNLHEENRDIEKHYEKADKDLANQINHLERQFDQKLKKFKEDLLLQPSEALEVKKELEEKIAISTVDAEGLLREINIYKKRAYISDKKIENIYTLLERLESKINT